MVLALRKMSEIFSIRFLRRQTALEFFDFGPAQVAKFARLERPEIHRPDADPLQFFHQPAEIFEHHADLVLAALDQAYLIPRVLGAVQKLESGRRGAASFQRNAVPE